MRSSHGLRSATCQMPEKSGLPSGRRGGGALRSGVPSALPRHALGWIVQPLTTTDRRDADHGGEDTSEARVVRIRLTPVVRWTKHHGRATCESKEESARTRYDSAAMRPLGVLLSCCSTRWRSARRIGRLNDRRLPPRVSSSARRISSAQSWPASSGRWRSIETVSACRPPVRHRIADMNAPLRQLFGLPDAHLRWAVARPPAMTCWHRDHGDQRHTGSPARAPGAGPRSLHAAGHGRPMSTPRCSA